MNKITTPLPSGFCEMIKEQFPAVSENLIQALEKRAECSVRFARGKGGERPGWMAEAEKIPWAEDGYYLPERPNFTLTPQWHAGQFYPQDASSMIVGKIVSSLPAGIGSVLDMCAAPGGKTTAILDALSERETLFVANEYDSRRAGILCENLVRYGDERVIVTNASASTLSSIGLGFDLILVDAPCSGEGMMRKEEMARKQWTEKLVEQCANLQREILSEAVKMLNPGGYLIYSTCTFNKSEDEGNAMWLINEYGLESIDTRLAGKYGIEGSADSKIYALRFFPGKTRGEGLFVALFKKSEDASPVAKLKKRKGGKGKASEALLPEWVKGEGLTAIVEGDRIIALPERMLTLYEEMKKVVRPMQYGIEAGKMKGRKMVPSHLVIMSRIFNTDIFPIVELDRDEALRYLRHESLQLDSSIPHGIVVAQYKGLPLGAMNNLGNRANNLYPQEMKIKWL